MLLTPKVIAYLAHEEGLVQEAYLDSGNVWTWALGVTNRSGHEVYPRYFHNPQSLEHCVDVSVWLIKNKYWPAVAAALPVNATEAQAAAALGFHWNSGRFPKYAGNFSKSVEIRNKGLLDDRRSREQVLWYGGKWPALNCPVYPVTGGEHPRPRFSGGKYQDILPLITAALQK